VETPESVGVSPSRLRWRDSWRPPLPLFLRPDSGVLVVVPKPNSSGGSSLRPPPLFDLIGDVSEHTAPALALSRPTLQKASRYKLLDGSVSEQLCSLISVIIQGSFRAVNVTIALELLCERKCGKRGGGGGGEGGGGNGDGKSAVNRGVSFRAETPRDRVRRPDSFIFSLSLSNKLGNNRRNTPANDSPFVRISVTSPERKHKTPNRSWMESISSGHRSV